MPAAERGRAGGVRGRAQGRSRPEPGTHRGSRSEQSPHRDGADGTAPGHAWGRRAEPGRAGQSRAEPPPPPPPPAPRGSPGRMKRLCEESSSDTESDGTIDVGKEEEYRWGLPRGARGRGEGTGGHRAAGAGARDRPGGSSRDAAAARRGEPPAGLSPQRCPGTRRRPGDVEGAGAASRWERFPGWCRPNSPLRLGAAGGARFPAPLHRGCPVSLAP